MQRASRTQSSNYPNTQAKTLRKYAVVSFELRKTLIQKVEVEGHSIRQAAKLLSINQSTAKAIVRVYRRNRRIYKPKRLINRKEATLAEPKIVLEVPQPQASANKSYQPIEMVQCEGNDLGRTQPSLQDLQLSFSAPNMYYTVPYGWGMGQQFLPYFYLI